MVFIIYALLAITQERNESYAQASLKLGKMYIFHNILTSKGCIGTGETGILDQTLLNWAEAGGELEQILFLLGHVPVQTTEKYLGCKQHRRGAVNDQIAIEP